VRAVPQLNISVNDTDAEDLLSRYQEAGFLYEKKMRLIDGNVGLMVSNWDRVLDTANDLFNVVLCEDGEGAWSSVTLWKTKDSNYVMQSLVSNRRTRATTRAVIIAAYRTLITKGARLRSGWFQPHHPVSSNLVSRMAEDEENTSVTNLHYFYHKIGSLHLRSPLTLKTVHGAIPSDLKRLVLQSRGPLFAQAEQLTNSDSHCATLNTEWRRYGLFRYQVPLVALTADQRPVGVALIHRAAFGLNPSLLENKCDILLDHGFSTALLEDAVGTLLDGAAAVYEDFPIDVIPVTCDEQTARIVQRVGAIPERKYSEVMTKDTGFAGCCHVVSEYYASRTN
jgi:hypothetical protein